jgi:hypothetical protein
MNTCPKRDNKCVAYYNITLFLERKFVCVRISASDHIGALIMAGLHELMFNLTNFYFPCTSPPVSTHKTKLHGTPTQKTHSTSWRLKRNAIYVMLRIM